MRSSLLVFVSCFLVLLVSACDMTNMPSNISGMSAKMDQTNQTTTDMDGKTTDMDNKMSVTNDAIHKQTLLVALDDMTSDQNSQVLNPVPFGMFAGGQTFAQNATEDELMDWYYAEFKDLTEGNPDDSQRVLVTKFTPKIDSSGNHVLTAQYSTQTIGGHAFEVPQTEWDFPQSYLDSFNNKKDIILNEMEVVSSFIPEDMLQSIVADQINAGGLRQQTAYLILNLRDSFERGALLDNSLYDDGLVNLDQVKEALRLVTDIDYIAHLPFAAKIGGTQILGYQDLSVNYVYEQQVDPSLLSQVVQVSASTPPTAFVPVTLPFDPKQPINNQTLLDNGEGDYALGDDKITVTSVSQDKFRSAEIAYDPSAYIQDWKDLKNYFQAGLPKAIQQSAEGKEYLAQIQVHIK
jgi:hypothetical protein